MRQTISALAASVALCAVVLLAAPPACGATYWVSASEGSDAADGSEQSPWKTLDKAINTADDGDTVLVMSGDYTMGRPKKQRTTDYVTFMPAPGHEGHARITNHFRPYVNCDYIRFQNMVFGYGMYVEPVNHFQVRGCTITGNPNQKGILASGTDILLEGNDVTGGKIGIVGHGTDVIVRYNDVHDQTSDGFRAGGTNQLFEGNYFGGNVPSPGAHPDHIQWYMGSSTRVRNVTVRGNYFDTRGQGLFGGAEGGTDDYFEDVLVENNVVVNSHLRCYSMGTTNNVTCRNNLFCYLPESQDPIHGGAALIYMTDWGGAPYIYANNICRQLSHGDSPHLTVTHNVLMQQTPDVPGNLGPVPITDIVVDFAAHNYAIRPDSPTIDAGDPNNATATDILGRPRDEHPDIGPLEYRAEDTEPLEVMFRRLLWQRRKAVMGYEGPVVTKWELLSDYGPAGTFVTELQEQQLIGDGRGVRRLRVTFDVPVDPNSLVAGVVTVTDASGADVSGRVASMTASPDGLQVNVTFDPPLPDAQASTVRVTDALTDTEGHGANGHRCIVLRPLAADVDLSGDVTNADVVAIRDAVDAPVTGANRLLDVDGSGTITGADMNVAEKRVGNALP